MATKDNEICSFAEANDLIVITKDEDFRNSFFLAYFSEADSCLIRKYF